MFPRYALPCIPKQVLLLCFLGFLQVAIGASEPTKVVEPGNVLTNPGGETTLGVTARGAVV